VVVKTKKGAEGNIAKALRHPLRVEILALLDKRVASPSEMALELNQPLGNLSYHVRELVRFQCIELVSTKPVRGATEHFYRAIRRPYFHDGDWVKLPQGARQGISSSVIQMIGRDAGNSLDDGVFDRRTDRHLSRTPLILDEIGWQAMTSMLNGMVERGLELEAEAAVRLANSPGATIRARLILMGFEAGTDETEG
jgi:DNA-binding transcriptional ArsR family regulator